MIENLSLKKNTIIFRDVYFRTTTLIVIVWVRISTKFPSIVPTDPEPWIIKETDLKPWPWTKKALRIISPIRFRDHEMANNFWKANLPSLRMSDVSILRTRTILPNAAFSSGMSWTRMKSLDWLIILLLTWSMPRNFCRLVQYIKLRQSFEMGKFWFWLNAI